MLALLVLLGVVVVAVAASGDDTSAPEMLAFGDFTPAPPRGLPLTDAESAEFAAWQARKKGGIHKGGDVELAMFWKNKIRAGFAARLKSNPPPPPPPGLTPEQAQKVRQCGAGELVSWMNYSGFASLEVSDVWGRPICGEPSNILEQTFRAVGYVLPYIPGIGTAASAALHAAIALGKGESLSDAALAGARGALPAHLQLVWDLGVAVASGADVDAAAADALVSQIPGGEVAYQQAQELVES